MDKQEKLNYADRNRKRKLISKSPRVKWKSKSRHIA